MEFLRNFVKDVYMGARRQMPVATRRAFAPALSPGQIFSSAKPPVTAPGAVLGITGRLWGPIGMAPATIEQAQKVFNPDDNIITSLRDLGGGLYNLTQGKPYLEGHSRSLYSPAAQEATRQAQIQYADRAKGSLQGPPVPGFTPLPAGPDSIRTTGASPVPQLSPQDRAYQQERARVEAMVKSNPDMQKQEIAEARAKVRDKGMEEWAKANPDLAAKVMSGQSGFSAIQGFVGGVGAPTTGPASAALQASPELNPASPTFVGGEGAPILRELSPELIKQYQEQLLKQAK